MPRFNIQRSNRQLVGSSGINPNAGFNNIGKAFGALGAVATGYMEKKQQLVDDKYIADSLVKASESSIRLKQEMASEREDFNGFSEDYMKGYEDIYRGYIDNAPSRAAAEKLERQFQNNRINEFRNTFSFETKSIVNQAVSGADDQIQILSNRVLDNPDTLETSLAEVSAVANSLDQAVSAQDKKQFIEDSKAVLSKSYLSGLVGANRFEEAQELLDSGQLDGILNPKDELAFENAIKSKKNQIEREEEKLEKEQQEAVHNDFFNRYINKTLRREDILASNLVATGKKSKMFWLNKIEADNKKASGLSKSVLKSIANVNAKMTSGSPFFNQGVNKDLDNYFEHVVAPNVSPEQMLEATLGFAETTGYVPSSVKRNIRAGLYNGTTQQAAQSAQLVSDIIDNPRLAGAFKTDDVARAKKIKGAVDAGVPIEEAVTAANNMYVQEGTPEYKAKIKEFNKLDLEPDVNLGSDSLLSPIDFIQNKFFDFPTEVPHEMKSEYRSIVRDLAIDRNLPLSEAQETAQKLVESNWGKTTVNGRPEFMRHSPELHYGIEGVDNKWIRNQLIENVKEVIPDVDKDSVMVIPGGKTRRGEHIYKPFYKSKFGPLVPVRDSEGSELLWKPDASQSLEVNKEILTDIQEATERRNAGIKASREFDKMIEAGPLGE